MFTFRPRHVLLCILEFPQIKDGAFEIMKESHAGDSTKLTTINSLSISGSMDGYKRGNLIFPVGALDLLETKSLNLMF